MNTRDLIEVLKKTDQNTRVAIDTSEGFIDIAAVEEFYDSSDNPTLVLIRH